MNGQRTFGLGDDLLSGRSRIRCWMRTQWLTDWLLEDDVLAALVGKETPQVRPCVPVTDNYSELDEGALKFYCTMNVLFLFSVPPSFIFIFRLGGNIFSMKATFQAM